LNLNLGARTPQRPSFSSVDPGVTLPVNGSNRTGNTCAA
jgi:hypothetical protein